MKLEKLADQLFPPSTPARFTYKHLALTALASGAISVFLSRNFFQSEKKITHRIETDYSVADPDFTRTINHLLGPPLVDGNKVRILQNGVEIFPAMLEAIRGAKKTITFENFVFSSGDVAAEISQALADKAREGVKVHFLQDAMGCNCVHGREIATMKEAGVEVEIFRYFNLRFNERTHRKLLVVDGRIGFIGGVGISDEWKGNGNDADKWRDTQYRVEGPVVAQIQQAFMDNWMQTRARVLHGSEYFPELKEVGDYHCQAFKSSSCEGADGARLMYLMSIASARKHIRIANAYFIPDDLLVATLAEASERGVKVEIIVPGQHTDQPLVRKTGMARWGPMLEAGIKFYEFQPSRYHCKYMIVDDVWVSVGSCNFDNRSLRLNEEANLNVLDKDFAKLHTAVFEDDKAQSLEVSYETWKHRPLHMKAQGLFGCLFRSQI